MRQNFFNDNSKRFDPFDKVRSSGKSSDFKERKITGQFKLANGIRQYYEVSGHSDHPWVTLIHGSGDNHLAWEYQVRELEKTYRVLTYDVRGHGATETPLDVNVNQKTFVEDLHGLLQSLNINSTAVLGYSMGAGIARNFAASYPEEVWGLVISNGGKLDPDAADSDDALKAIFDRKESIRSAGMDSVFAGWLSSVYTPEFVLARPEIIEWHRNII